MKESRLDQQNSKAQQRQKNNNKDATKLEGTKNKKLHGPNRPST